MAGAGGGNRWVMAVDNRKAVAGDRQFVAAFGLDAHAQCLREQPQQRNNDHSHRQAGSNSGDLK
jgi:hypothetical protein